MRSRTRLRYRGLYAGSASWSPASLTGLIWWLKAGPSWTYTDAGVTPAADTDAVYQWDDRSSNAKNLIQATSGKRPTLNRVAGQWVVRGDGIDDWMQSAATLGTVGTVAVGYARSGPQPAYSSLWNDGSGFHVTSSSNRYCHSFTISELRNGTWWEDGVVINPILTATKTTPTRVIVRLTSPVANRVDRIFANDVGSTTGGFDFYEVVVTSGVLSDDDAGLLDAYLAGEMGV